MYWKVGKLTDRGRILAFLDTDRVYAAYAIGDLEPGLFEQAEWFGAETKGELGAMAMHFTGLKTPVLFLMGDREGLRQILDRGIFTGPVHINCQPEHMSIIHEIFEWDEPVAMWRMVLDRRRFHPVTHGCVRLTQCHVKGLREIYDQGGMPGFTEQQIEKGIFYGVFDNGRLIAAAGTHLVSHAYDMAAVGNVYTRPENRGQGHGKATTGAVIEELIRLDIRDIVLNAAQANGPAVRIYEDLGFRRGCPFFEGRALLKKTSDQHV